MHALRSLHHDHRLLLELTDALEVFAGVLPRSRAVPVADLEAFAYAFREFADNLHYEKEECVLMPFLTRHGYDWNGKLLTQMRDDHNQNRYLIDVLHQAAQRKGVLSREDQRRLVSTASALADVQRKLFAMQDIELFPEVSSSIDGDALAALSADLADFDTHVGPRALQLKRLITGLSLRYSPLPVGS